MKSPRQNRQNGDKESYTNNLWVLRYNKNYWTKTDGEELAGRKQKKKNTIHKTQRRKKLRKKREILDQSYQKL